MNALVSPTDAGAHVPTRVHLPSLLVALVIMLVGSIYPLLFADAAGKADHGLALALFWAMSAGFVAGVGFRPRKLLIRLLLSPLACWLGVILAGLRLASLTA